MLDIQILRKDLNTVIEQLANRGFNFPKAQFIALEESRKDIQVKTESLQAMRNQLSKQIGLLKSQKQNADALMQEVNQVNIDLELNKTMLEEIQKQLGHILLNVPNLPDASVPLGKDETQNQCIHSWGTPKILVDVKDHADLGALLGLDFDTAAKLSGARFSILKGKMATLHRALVQFMLNQHTNNGYTEMYVPYLVNGKSMQGTGQLPKFEEDLFKLGKIGASDENFYLIPTAEVPLTNTVADTIQDSEALPIKMVAHTPCFRSEAGSHGRDTKGMIRQHQFDKVELVQIVKPEDSMQSLEDLVIDAENILKALELPFRRMLLCTGDMGFGSCKTYDLEVWLPSQQTYREISSCSNMGDFQARRMQARFKTPQSKETQFVHTLNGSALAVGRTLVAILENNQQQDGSVLIPKVLQAYCGFEYLTPLVN